MQKILHDYYKNDAKKMRILVDKVLFKLKYEVDKDDFYSLADEIFVDVLKRYNPKQDFDGFLYSCLCNKFKTEMTRRNRIKRKSEHNAVSIDTPIGDEDGSRIGDIIADNKTVEDIVFSENHEAFSTKMQTYLSRLSSLQKKVLELISVGFNADEITTELHITMKQYNDCYNAIHAFRNIEVLF